MFLTSSYFFTLQFGAEGGEHQQEVVSVFYTDLCFLWEEVNALKYKRGVQCYRGNSSRLISHSEFWFVWDQVNCLQNRKEVSVKANNTKGAELNVCITEVPIL